MTTGDAAALADGAFLAGVDDRTATVHAVARSVAAAATEERTHRAVLAQAICHRTCRIAVKIGAFAPGNQWLNGNGDRCADCAWILALHTGDTENQLTALIPLDRELELTQRLLDEPLVAANIARAILDAGSPHGPDHVSGDEVGPSALSAQLGHLSRHAPVILLPEACEERTCDHPRALDAVEPTAECTYPVIDIACPACSLVALDTYAGDRLGDFHDECTVAAPCGVLAAFAAFYHVTLGGRRTLTPHTQTPGTPTEPGAPHPNPGCA